MTYTQAFVPVPVGGWRADSNYTSPLETSPAAILATLRL